LPQSEKIDFVHLHSHSDNSLLDGAVSVPRMVARARELGMPALALTDHGNLFGAIEFYRACEKVGIKPIVGMEAYVAPTSRHDRKKNEQGETAYHLTLLCRNEKGYRNLMKLSTLAYKEGFYYKPRVDRELLRAHHDGLIALSGCPAGEFGSHCQRRDFESAVRVAAEHADLFGKENYYLEIQQHGLEVERNMIEGAQRAAEALSLKLVATNDCHYLAKDDAEAHDVLLALSTGTTVADPNRLRFETPEFYLKTPVEMAAAFPQLPQALRATVEIAEKCNLQIDFNEIRLPRYPTPEGETPSQTMRRLCVEGLRRRYGDANDEASKRLEYELSVIERMGFASYFLVVMDFVQFAKKDRIAVGPGRGSAAGSIVAYLLGITDIDPLRYGLLFERFLNPERREMPDIDIDFAPEGRERVIEYIRTRYGEENVSQIVTFHQMKARAVVRDVARVLGLPLQTADQIAKRIPTSQILHIKLGDVLSKDAEMRELLRKDADVAKLWSIAVRLEDLRRHSSKHAGGVVISDKPLVEYCPLFTRDQDVATQYDMGSLAALGLLKMDLLGVETLSILDRTVKLVERTRNVKVDLDHIPLDDPAPFDMIAQGRVKGVFQLEVSRSAREMVMRLKPRTLDDIMALVALNRPGPMTSGMADSYIDRRNGKEAVAYAHPSLEPMLRDTCGAIIYQEQVMLIAHKLAGFTLAEADKLRKAMGKKIQALMDEYQGKFVEGCKKNGVGEELAKAIWNDISKFAQYGFNKSHSAAYGVIAYRTAYLKAKFPEEFMSVVMSSNMSDEEKLMGYIEECREMGIPVLPPDANESEWDFLPSGGKIRIGLGAVKQVGDRAVRALVEARRGLEARRFQSFEEFVETIDTAYVDKRAIDAMIRAGAFDSLGVARAKLFAQYEELLRRADSKRRNRTALLFGDQSFEALPDVPEWPPEVLLAREKEALGFYITSNPIAKHRKLVERMGVTPIEELGEPDAGSREVKVAGVLSKVKLRVVQGGRNKGAHYLVFDIQDLSGRIEAVMFASSLEDYRKHMVDDAVVVLDGSVDFRQDNVSLVARRVEPIDEVYRRIAHVKVELDLREAPPDAIDRIQAAVKRHSGRTPLRLEVFTVEGRRAEFEVPGAQGVELNSELLSGLEEIVGRSKVTISLLQATATPAARPPRRAFQRS
jgi:DNA polymerase-3 subunit alpha